MNISLAATNPACQALKHGTANAYARYRCRCREARQDVNRHQRSHYARQRAGISGANHRDVDPEAVQRAVRGEYPRPRLGLAERRLAVTLLTAQETAARDIAHLLGIAERSVVRHRAAARRATR